MHMRLFTICLVLLSNLALVCSIRHHQANPGRGHGGPNGPQLPHMVPQQIGQQHRPQLPHMIPQQFGTHHRPLHVNEGHGHMNHPLHHLIHGQLQSNNYFNNKEHQNFVFSEINNGMKVPTTTTESPESKYNSWREQWWTEHYRSCGKQKTQPKFQLSRIMGGTDAVKGSWPWMISLFNNLMKQPICAAVLISDQWALTAAHCFSSAFNNEKFITARVGIYNSSSYSREASEQSFKIEKVIQNAEMNMKKIPFDNDIALVKLDKPVQYSPFVQPICLPNKEKERSPVCAITGWGRFKVPVKTPDPNAWPQVLQQTRIPVLPDDLCASLYEGKITQNMFCAGYRQGGVDACQGDSGGPLQCEDRGQWFMRGITSWGGQTYKECAEPLQPGVYTKVSNYVEWILREIYINY